MHTPTSHSNTLPIRENTLWSITSRISEILESEACQQKSQELQVQLTRFQETLEAKSEEIQYDYSDYEQRLFRWEEELEGILEQDQALRLLYENLLKATEFAPHLKQVLWDKILFDRVLELWPPAQEFPKPDTISFDELKRTPSIPPYIIIKDLPHNASVQELEEVFLKIENAPWVLAIDLTYNNLWTFWQKQLHTIFSHLWGKKSIKLWNNNIWQLEEAKLHAIFSYLRNVKTVYLWYNDVCKLDEAWQHAIFSHLRNVKTVDVRYNDLWKLNELWLQWIFSHLRNVRKINLRRNCLRNLDTSSLHAIFSHLSWVKSMNLSRNNLWQFDEPRLQAIFSHLFYIDEVVLESQEMSSKLESLFPNLIGKIKIV